MNDIVVVVVKLFIFKNSTFIPVNLQLIIISNTGALFFVIMTYFSTSKNTSPAIVQPKTKGMQQKAENRAVHLIYNKLDLV